MTRTLESALNTISDMLQRVRELAVQAGNGTNSSRDRSFLQQEINQLTQEIIECPLLLNSMERKLRRDFR